MDDASASLGLFLFFLLAAKPLILLNFPSHELYITPVNFSMFVQQGNDPTSTLLFFVYPQEWVALENLEVDGSPGMTSIPVSVFKVSPLNLFQWPWRCCTFPVSSRPGWTTTLVSLTSETFPKGAQACSNFFSGSRPKKLLGALMCAAHIEIQLLLEIVWRF